jgi:hypothetical protein
LFGGKLSVFFENPADLFFKPTAFNLTFFFAFSNNLKANDSAIP